MSFLSNFLLEIEGSELPKKVWEAVPVHLVLVWSKSDGRKPSYGQTTVLQNRNIFVLLAFGSGARILLFSGSKFDYART